MPPVDITSTMENLQELEVNVRGPGSARRMFLITGAVRTEPNAGSPLGNARASFAVVIGPELGDREFLRATASAWPTQISLNRAVVDTSDIGDGGTASLNAFPSAGMWAVDYVDADYDDESGRTHLRIDAATDGHVGTVAVLERVAFHVTILAAAASE